MNAKEAAKASDAVANDKRVERLRLAKKLKDQKRAADEYARNGGVKFLLRQFKDEWLPHAIAQGRRGLNFVAPAEITATLCKAALSKAGYKTTGTKSVYHEAYEGTSEYGRSDSYQAFTTWEFEVSW